MKPITLYSHSSGPNPWKVAMILEELDLPYEMTFVEMTVIKAEPYTSVNPNGRVPAIVDPNTGLTLWESGAIIEYLIDTYDKEKKLSFASYPEKYLTKQYLFFQTSGQGPYYGQAAWFAHFHPEDVPSAKERYKGQIIRVIEVLNRILEGKDYLVGDKCTYADIAFVTWDSSASRLVGTEWEDVSKKNPNYIAWHQRVTARPAIKKVLQNWNDASKK